MVNYFIAAVGVPVFLHYCGGQLEKVSYVIKGKSCCDGEDDNTNDNDCCKNENFLLKNNPDFTFKPLTHFDFTKITSALFYTSINFSEIFFKQVNKIQLASIIESPPPKVQNTLVISTSVLKI